MAADDSFDEFSFPEISPELWAELENAALSTQTSEVVPATPQPQIDTDSDDNLWAEFPELSGSDWPEPEPDRQPEHSPNPEPDFVPLHYLGLDSQDIIDIEDYTDMAKFKKMASLIRPFPGALSVSNIVHPLWCEYKAKYDLVGFKHRGADQRPAVFEIEKKVVVENKEVIKKVSIRVDKAVAKVVETRAIIGNAVHQKLEEDVAPKLSVQTETREDRWGLKFLNMLSGLKCLQLEGLWVRMPLLLLSSIQAKQREFPVFGFVNNISVTGIIDELTLRPVIASSPTSGNILAIIDTKTKNGTRTIVSVSREYKIQLMLYKKLLDGLLSPTFNWSQFFKSKGVDSSRSFSDAFRAQLINIVETNKLDTSIHGVTTLEDLRKPWIVAVQALNLMSDQTDQELTIVYRKPGKLFKSPTQPGNRANSDIIDVKSFNYDETFMKETVKHSLEFWNGRRPLEGVSIGDTWKCDVCEYKADCEWREEQAAIFSQRKRA